VHAIATCHNTIQPSEIAATVNVCMCVCVWEQKGHPGHVLTTGGGGGAEEEEELTYAAPFSLKGMESFHHKACILTYPIGHRIPKNKTTAKKVAF
jgi:hypothetical protein